MEKCFFEQKAMCERMFPAAVVPKNKKKPSTNGDAQTPTPTDAAKAMTLPEGTQKMIRDKIVAFKVVSRRSEN